MIESVPNVLFMVLRILIACLCGGAIGFERTKRLKEAGIRTHCIIAAGAALLMIISKYGFVDLLKDGVDYAGTKGADPSRIASQIVSGISFLGAGVIFKNGNSVKGLTTAAGIWSTAAVGMAIGYGMYVPGVIGALVIMMVQILFHRYNIGADAFSDNDVHIIVEDSPEFRERFAQMLEEKHIQIITMRIERQSNNEVSYSVILRTRRNFGAQEAIRLFSDFPGVKSLSV